MVDRSFGLVDCLAPLNSVEPLMRPNSFYEQHRLERQEREWMKTLYPA